MAVKVYSASDLSDDIFFAIIPDDFAPIVLRADAVGLVGWQLKTLSGDFDKLTADDKLDAIAEIRRISVQIELADISLDNFKVEPKNGNIDASEWYFCDDYLEPSNFGLFHSITGRFFKIQNRAIGATLNPDDVVPLPEMLDAEKFLKKFLKNTQ